MDAKGTRGLLGPVPDPDALAPADVAALIDHTNLKAVTGPAEIEALCREAVEFGFASVCVNPVHVALAARLLAGTPVDVCTVVGFPLGANAARVKAYEASAARAEGAVEIDMVLAIGALRAGAEGAVRDDVAGVVAACEGGLVKVILETCVLTDDQIARACALSRDGGARFVKTSTGFGEKGATEHHVRLMRGVVGDGMGVKASGGIGDAARARAMLRAGASRIGASAGAAIVRGWANP